MAPKKDICMTTALPAQAPTMENMCWCQHDPHVVHRQWTAGFIIFHQTVASSRTCKPHRQGQPMQGSKKIKLVARLRPAPPPHSSHLGESHLRGSRMSLSAWTSPKSFPCTIQIGREHALRFSSQKCRESHKPPLCPARISHG